MSYKSWIVLFQGEDETSVEVIAPEMHAHDFEAIVDAACSYVGRTPKSVAEVVAGPHPITLIRSTTR